MPRPPNPTRQSAIAAGEKTYTDEAAPCFCGGVVRYVSNTQCVECAIAKGKARYAAMDSAALAALKAKDHTRYVTRLRRNKAPTHRRARRAARDPLDP